MIGHVGVQVKQKERGDGGIHKKILTKRFSVEVVTTALLITIPANTLYLYYIGVWHEPRKALEIMELVILYAVPLFAIWRHYQYITGRLGS